MVDVAAGVAGGVEVGRWDELGVVVWAEPNGPLLVMYDPVVVSTEEYAVVDVGRAAVGPGGDVVGVAPSWWTVTAGEGAASVAKHQCAPDRADMLGSVQFADDTVVDEEIAWLRTVGWPTATSV